MRRAPERFKSRTALVVLGFLGLASAVSAGVCTIALIPRIEQWRDVPLAQTALSVPPEGDRAAPSPSASSLATPGSTSRTDSVAGSYGDTTPRVQDSGPPTTPQATLTAPPRLQSPSPGGVSPTPLPTPPRVVTKSSKIGIGIYGLHPGDDVVENVRRIQPSIILVQNPDIGLNRKLREMVPKAFIVGRVFFPQQPLDNPEERGVELADIVGGWAVARKGLVDAWVSYNEPVASGDYEAYKAYNNLQVAFARRLQGFYGVSAIAGNDFPGAIEPADYATYFAQAIRESRYFGVHAYSAPKALSLRAHDAGFYALRYRLIHDALERAGVRDVQMVVTEAGLAEGWQGRISEEEMAEEFKWLADEMEKDPYMKGMAVFGIFEPGHWPEFEMKDSRLLDLLGAYQPPRDR